MGLYWVDWLSRRMCAFIICCYRHECNHCQFDLMDCLMVEAMILIAWIGFICVLVHSLWFHFLTVAAVGNHSQITPLALGTFWGLLMTLQSILLLQLTQMHSDRVYPICRPAFVRPLLSIYLCILTADEMLLLLWPAQWPVLISRSSAEIASSSEGQWM